MSRRERDEIQAKVEASFQAHVDFASKAVRDHLLKVAKRVQKRMPKRRIQFIDAMGSYGFIVSHPGKNEDGRSTFSDWVKNMPDMLVLRCKPLKMLSDAEEWYGRVMGNPNICIDDIDLLPLPKCREGYAEDCGYVYHEVSLTVYPTDPDMRESSTRKICKACLAYLVKDGAITHRLTPVVRSMKS